MRRGIASAALCAALALFSSGCASGGKSASPSTPALSPSSSAPTSTPSPSPSKVKPGVWRLLPPAPLKTPLDSFTAAWDGKEVFLSGRVCPAVRVPIGYTDTVAYNPSTNAWRSLPPFHGPKGCFQGTDNAFWDGKELLLIGITNAAYDPATNTWRKLPPGGLGNFADVAAWTGHQTLGYGGGCCGEAYAMARSFTPGTNSWSDPPAGPLGGRRGVIGVWDGKELVVAGGSREVSPVTGFKTFASGAAYDPASGSWSGIAPMPAPRQYATAVWDGSEMLVVGGSPGGASARSYVRGLSFDPSTDAWRQLPPMAYPRDGAAAVWTGSQMLVWGGATVASGGKVAPPHGEAFDPVTQRWSPLPMSPLRGRSGPATVWTGTQMFVWGGNALGGRPLYDGAIYTPGA